MSVGFLNFFFPSPTHCSTSAQRGRRNLCPIFSFKKNGSRIFCLYFLLNLSIHAAIGLTPAWSWAEDDMEDSTSLKKEGDEHLPLENHKSEAIDNIEADLENRFDIKKEQDAQKAEVQKAKDSLFNEFRPPSLEDLHTSLSGDILGLSESIDTFFVNDRIIDGRNRTHLRILSSIASIEREGLVDNIDFRLRFRLPRLEKKIQFEVNNLDNSLTSDSNRGTNPIPLTVQEQSRARQQNTTAGLSFFKDTLGVQSKFTLGFIFRDFAPFGNFRLSKNIKFNEKDSLMFISDVFGDTEDRTGHRATIYFDRALSPHLLFRFLNESVYRNEFNSFETVHGLNFYQIFNDRHSIGYTAQVRSENLMYDSSFYLRSYDLLTTYRYRIFKRHTFLDLIPAVIFPKEHEFQSHWSFTIRLEIILGSV